MKALLEFSFLLFSMCVWSQDIMINVSARDVFSLNGKWNTIIDPYENGYYDYRYEPYDRNPEPYRRIFPGPAAFR